MNSADALLIKIEEQIKKADLSVKFSEKGEIVEIRDGIAIVSGLWSARFNEILKFPNNIRGLVLNLGSEDIWVLILWRADELKLWDSVETTGEVLSIWVWEEYLGRVVDWLAQPIDWLSMINTSQNAIVENIAPWVMARKPVSRPLETWIKAIDAMIPIGRGQRELIIWDRQTGKTALILDSFLNQKNSDVICIYVAIGQKDSKVKQFVKILKEYGVMEKSIVVNATSANSAVLQYLAPYVGCTLAEYFMQKGRDVLIAYDDLTKHAVAYREISLLLRRPPAREAYPWDIFYLHSRLLERSAQLNDEMWGGSMTALPVVETLEWDISAYIPTNIISITDGQIFLDTELFNAGVKPAIDVWLSVSRVGSSAQTKPMKQVAGKLRIQLASFRELAKFLQFGSDVDDETAQQIKKWKILTEVLKQIKYSPLPSYQQVIVLYAVINDYLNDMPIDKIYEFEKVLMVVLENRYMELERQLQQADLLTPEMEKEIKSLIKEVMKEFI